MKNSPRHTDPVSVRFSESELRLAEDARAVLGCDRSQLIRHAVSRFSLDIVTAAQAARSSPVDVVDDPRHTVPA